MKLKEPEKKLRNLKFESKGQFLMSDKVASA